MKKNGLVAGLDLGTTKVSMVVLERGESGRPQVVGLGTSPSDGIRRGAIVNLEKAVAAIRKATDEAERMIGRRLDEVYVGVAGDHVRSMNSRGVVAVARPESEISRGDVDRVIELARAVSIPMDRQILHVLPQDFSVDDQDGIKDAVGMCGMRLEAEVHIVTAAGSSVQNVVKCVNRAGLSVADMVLQPLASSLAVLDDDERELGVGILDLGGGTTDVGVFFGGSIRHTAVVGLGGNNVTSDIALGLRTPMGRAEELKLAHGCASAARVGRDYEIDVPGVGGRSPRSVSRQVLSAIIEPRVEEILRMAQREIRRSDYADLLGAGLVVTGGTSLTEGITELAEEVLGQPVRQGVALGVDGVTAPVDDPRLATGVGLCLYGLRQRENGVNGRKSGASMRFFQGLKRWVGEFV